MTNKETHNQSLTRKQYNMRDLSTMLGMAPITIRRRFKKNLFPAPKLIGNRLFWSADIVDRWVLENLGVHHG